MHVYANNVTEWVVAGSVRDAASVLRQHYLDWDCGQADEADTDFHRVPDEKVLTMDDGMGNKTEKTAAEWAKTNGRGFLMTTEF